MSLMLLMLMYILFFELMMAKLQSYNKLLILHLLSMKYQLTLNFFESVEYLSRGMVLLLI